jgi:phosphoenolpyruvate-protein kinase (PTS system EI component)
MVSALDELLLADALLEECCAELQAEGLPFDDDLETGIMVEVPAAVLAAEHLARFVDFLSIGTNDLTQYVMAADRGNAAVAGLVNPLQPAVIHAIHQVVQAGHGAGIWVGLCGELGGDPIATPLLAGLGLDELSMNATSIPRVKARIRSLDAATAAEIATTVLGMLTVQEIEDYLREFAGQGEEP